MVQNKKNNEYFVIFGGGGVRGFCYCGAYKALIENNLSITGYAGSSIGALFATLIAVGYNYDEIYNMMSEIKMDLFRDININFKKELAFSKGDIFLEWLREKIEHKFYGKEYKKGKMSPVKFCDINTKLIIYSVDLLNMKYKELSCLETPNFELAMAVRASVSMPGLFRPLDIDNSLLVDGDLLKATPLWRITNSIKSLEKKILEFRLEDNETVKKVENSLDYINRVYNAICGFSTDYIIDLYNEKDQYNYIKINTPDISVVDFLIPKEKKQELYDIGYNTTMSYFKDFIPQKTKTISKKYEGLLKHLIKFQKEFGRKSYINAYLNLCETFIYLCDEKKYLDKKVYDSLCSFKDNFKKCYCSYSVLGFKRASVKNKEKLAEELLYLIKTITNKI